MYKQKFGEARVKAMLPQMTRTFADVGVRYSLGGMTGNTFDSHRLAEWAKAKYGLQKQDALMTQMFDAYFSKEQFIGDHQVLVKAAQAAGLPADEARAVLADESAYAKEVQEGLHAARSMRVSGVPFFVIHPPEGKQGRPYGLSGAQDPETFKQVFEEFGLDE
eukprot:TRINITY_DN23491_c0_g2_i1.p1 TRINITY_DN23491_c0_g2~~TRINITY_DN23491_c0_g2_i1.p1  ORF type:complete len:163 (+),score=53.03 TRINITY_DN23491_c0_g2_i1:273-761(+)